MNTLQSTSAIANLIANLRQCKSDIEKARTGLLTRSAMGNVTKSEETIVEQCLAIADSASHAVGQLADQMPDIYAAFAREFVENICNEIDKVAETKEIESLSPSEALAEVTGILRAAFSRPAK
jgi:hypothetical protein